MCVYSCVCMFLGVCIGVCVHGCVYRCVGVFMDVCIGMYVCSWECIQACVPYGVPYVEVRGQPRCLSSPSTSFEAGSFVHHCIPKARPPIPHQPVTRAADRHALLLSTPCWLQGSDVRPSCCTRASPTEPSPQPLLCL